MDTTERRERDNKERRSRRDTIIKNVKTGGDVIMYAGSAGLMIPAIQKAKENQNGLLGACAVGAGAVISIGLGGIASKFLHNVIDKAVSFWDDVKAKDKKEDEDDG